MLRSAYLFVYLFSALASIQTSRVLAQGDPAPAQSKPKLVESRLAVTPIPPLAEIALSDENSKWPWVYDFDSSARFEWLGFDRDGSPIPMDALTIYEGMKLWVHRDGSFKVRFIVESPLTQISVRMQFTVLQAGHLPGTVTLPPIPIRPTINRDANTTSQSFVVEYTGRSDVLKRVVQSLIAEAAARKSWADEEWRVAKTEFDAAKRVEEAWTREVKDLEKKLAASATLKENKEPVESSDGSSEANPAVKPTIPHGKPGDPAPILEGSPKKDHKAERNRLEEKLRLARLQLIQAEVASRNSSDKLAKLDRAVMDANAIFTAINGQPAEAFRLNAAHGIEIRRGGTARFGGVPQSN